MANVIQIPKTNAQLVDRIGQLRAQIVPTQELLKLLEGELKSRGAGAYQGTLWDASVSLSTRETLDMAAVREKLSPQFISAHTRESEVVTLRVTARKLAIAA